jgi:hypothetical protein
MAFRHGKFGFTVPLPTNNLSPTVLILDIDGGMASVYNAQHL